jgi:integrase
VAEYQKARQGDGVTSRTVNLEVGVLRSILRRYRMWEAVSADVDFLKENPSPGRALTAEEERSLLDAASNSRCRSLYPVVMLALNTGMRASEIRALTWAQVDLLGQALTVGKSKTSAGTGRFIPLNPRAVAVLTHWRGLFPDAQPEHYVFPHEKYDLAGDKRQPCAWEVEPTEPMHRWKIAWESARTGGGVLPLPRPTSHVYLTSGRVSSLGFNGYGSSRARIARHDGAVFSHPHPSEASRRGHPQRNGF